MKRSHLRKILVVLAGTAAAAHLCVACVSSDGGGTELNPQPLPPSSPPGAGSGGSEGDKAGSNTDGPQVPSAAPDSDAGAVDGGDAGDAAHDANHEGG